MTIGTLPVCYDYFDREMPFKKLVLTLALFYVSAVTLGQTPNPNTMSPGCRKMYTTVFMTGSASCRLTSLQKPDEAERTAMCVNSTACIEEAKQRLAQACTKDANNIMIKVAMEIQTSLTLKAYCIKDGSNAFCNINAATTGCSECTRKVGELVQEEMKNVASADVKDLSKKVFVDSNPCLGCLLGWVVPWDYGIFDPVGWEWDLKLESHPE
jgi:hypothetical protein